MAIIQHVNICKLIWRSLLTVTLQIVWYGTPGICANIYVCIYIYIYSTQSMHLLYALHLKAFTLNCFFLPEHLSSLCNRPVIYLSVLTLPLKCKSSSHWFGQSRLSKFAQSRQCVCLSVFIFLLLFNLLALLYLIICNFLTNTNGHILVPIKSLDKLTSLPSPLQLSP